MSSAWVLGWGLSGRSGVRLGGPGSIEPRKLGLVGSGNGSIDSSITNSGAKGAHIFFFSIQNGKKIFSPGRWQVMTFLNPLDALIPKIPFFFFYRISGSGHLWGLGVNLGRSLGGPSIEPFFGGGGPARGLH